MNIQASVIFILLIGFSLSSCADGRAEYSKKDVTLSQYQWKGALPKKNKVRVINAYGNVSTRNTSHRNVALTGVIQKVGVNAPQPEVVVRDHDGVTEIEVVYHDKVEDSYGRRIGRMDIGVYVPKGVVIDIETSFGDIKAKKHHSNIIAKTQSGKVKIASSGTVKASTFSGDMSVTLTQWKASRFTPKNKKHRYQVISKKGNIAINFDNDIDLIIAAESGKKIKSNDKKISKLIKTNDENLSQSLDSILGTGERKIKVSSEEGSIQFNISPSSFNQDTTASSPHSFEGDIRQLPKVESWKPGDAISEVEDGRSDKKQTYQ